MTLGAGIGFVVRGVQVDGKGETMTQVKDWLSFISLKINAALKSASNIK